MSLLDFVIDRGITQVKLAGVKGMDVYVRTLTAAELIAVGERALAAQTGGPKLRKALELEVVLCDKDGNLLLKAGDGLALIDRLWAADMQRISQASEGLNVLSDASLEEALKN